MQTFRSFDPLYGRSEFSRFETALIRTPEVQRLRNVRMCNINSLLITGASEISRFEHTLGVVRLAKEWAKASESAADTAAVISAAAMLHDMKTGPFGHSLEYIFADDPELEDLNHQRVGERLAEGFFQRTKANVSYFGSSFQAPAIIGDNWNLVADAIAGDGPLGPLISSQMDLDNLDNVVRLAYHVGIASRDDSHIALSLAKDLRVTSGKLSIQSSSIAHVKRWQSLRHHLYRYLLHDWAEFSAKAMLTKAVELATSADIIGIDSWILTDDLLIHQLISGSVGVNQNIGTLAKRIMLADLYYPVSLRRSSTTNGYGKLSTPAVKRALEAKMSQALKCQTIVHVILDRSKTDRAVNLHIRDQNRDAEIGESSNELLIGLFSSREQPEKLNSKAAKEFQRAISEIVPESQPLADPLEDPFRNSANQFQLI
ncbi:HD domain-containing protein [Agrobacterium tumefaciens]|uniref:HD domain-containing protein n=1 Tax=Agrobacterium tumefaciens TaxID=358 RepID=UPI003BA004D8